MIYGHNGVDQEIPPEVVKRCSTVVDDVEEPQDEDDADEQHQVPEEESKVANQHRSSVDMTAHPQVIDADHTSS